MNNTNTLYKARISSVQKNRFTLITNGDFNADKTATLSGKFYSLQLDLPIVGDYVMTKSNPFGEDVIESVEPRKTVFSRPNRSGHAEGYVKNLLQEDIVANFDYVFIVSSLNQNFNQNRIARYISLTLKAGAKPVVLLTKADLCSDSESYVQIVKEISEKVDVHAISSFTGYGIKNLSQYLLNDKTIVFLGSSGVGKSTLLNTIANQNLMKVNTIRDSDGKGRHTTTHRELFLLPCGTTIIDTPGLRELGMSDVEDGINDTFSDITDLFSECKFRNCTHTTEPGCAIQTAIANGTLDEERWNLYRNLQCESDWGKEKMKEIRMFTRNLKKNSIKHSKW